MNILTMYLSVNGYIQQCILKGYKFGICINQQVVYLRFQLLQHLSFVATEQ